MISLSDQAWWVDVVVVLLPFLVGAMIYMLIYGKYCVECGHKATKLHQKRQYCERCFHQSFGETRVILERVPACLPAALPREQPVPQNAATPVADKAQNRTNHRRIKRNKKKVRSRQ
jgi:hypothetical protein